MPIWSDSYLNQLISDAEENIVNDAPKTIFFRFSLATTSGQSVYSLPTYVRGITRVTWKGTKLDPISFRKLTEISPKSVVVSESTKDEASTARPRNYCLHPNDYRNIRFYPTPDETISASSSDEVYGADIPNKVIISCWRNPDPTDETIALPAYIARRTRKAYVLSRAFAIEGKGQDLEAAAYYKSKYEILINFYREITEGLFISKRFVLQTPPYFNLPNLPTPVLPAAYTEL